MQPVSRTDITCCHCTLAFVLRMPVVRVPVCMQRFYSMCNAMHRLLTDTCIYPANDVFDVILIKLALVALSRESICACQTADRANGEPVYSFSISLLLAISFCHSSICANGVKSVERRHRLHHLLRVHIGRHVNPFVFFLLLLFLFVVVQ